MRYVAVLLAVFVVATAAAAQEWKGAESAAAEPIVLRPSEPPAETAAMLLDLKPSATTRATGATVAAPATRRTATPRTATQRAATPRAVPPSRSQTLAPSRPRAQQAPARSVGAAPAPATPPVPIQQTRDDDGGDDDDSDDDGDGGGGDDD